MTLTPLATPRWTTSHVVRWCAAQQNWHKIHYDLPFARDVEGLPNLVINGAFKQQLLVHFLVEAFEGDAWPWRLDFRFEEIDYVGEHLEVRGEIHARERVGDLDYVEVAAAIHNLDREHVSARADCVVVVDPVGRPVVAAPPVDDLPPRMQLSEDIGIADGELPPAVVAAVGEVVEEAVSVVPVDLSRLRLFAEAVGCIRPRHHDPATAEGGPYGVITAPPLFPPYALESMPGSHPLSEDADADGTESSSEIGRHFQRIFGFKSTRAVNAGNAVEIHSLAHVGEHVRGVSRLANAKARVGRRSGPMMILQALNHYSAAGRPLLTERQTVVYR